MAAVWAAGPEPMIATEECILRRWERPKGRQGEGAAAGCGRMVEAARRGRDVAVRMTVRRRNVEENVVAVIFGLEGWLLLGEICGMESRAVLIGC